MSSSRGQQYSAVRVLGQGSFGKVWLVSHKRTGTPYALKQLSKREIMGHHQVEGVIREKNIIDIISKFTTRQFRRGIGSE